MKTLKIFLKEIEELQNCKEILDDILSYWSPYNGFDKRICDESHTNTPLNNKIREYIKFDDSE